MTSQILKFLDFTKTQKSKYLESKENIIFYTSRATLLQKVAFVTEVIFNTRNRELNFKNTLWTLCPVSLFNVFSGYMRFDALIIDILIRGSLSFL